MKNVGVTRKLIDIKNPILDMLKSRAKKKGVSLKRYMEDVLEEDAMRHDVDLSGIDPRVRSLIGIVRQPSGEELASDEKARYILSK